MTKKMTEKKENKKQDNRNEEIVGTRGRIFQGYVIKKFEKRVVIEFERTVYNKKYERFYKKKTKIHARIPSNFEVEVGDYVEAGECRPLSKIIHFILIKEVRRNQSK